MRYGAKYVHCRFFSPLKLFVSLFFAELSKNSVHQTPAAIIKDLGVEILINCSHSNTNFDMIQWYKQSAGKSDMALVGFARYSSPAVEDKFKETHNVSGDGRSLSSLHIPKLSRSEDRAVYFCAASEAQCCTNPPSLTKTFSDETSYTITIIHQLITQSRDTLNDSHQPAGSS